jgi:hypothetical protein
VRVLHFIPAYGSRVHAALLSDVLATMVAADAAGDEYALQYVDLQPVTRARNLAVRTAQRGAFDLLLMQDADVYGADPRDPLYTYLRESLLANEAAAVGAAVAKRSDGSPNCTPCHAGEVFDGEVGTGLMLIDLRRLEGLPLPWFEYETTTDGAECQVGEDIHFCRLLAAHGHRVLVDARAETIHVGDAPYKFSLGAAVKPLDVDGRYPVAMGSTP